MSSPNDETHPIILDAADTQTATRANSVIDSCDEFMELDGAARPVGLGRILHCVPGRRGRSAYRSLSGKWPLRPDIGNNVAHVRDVIRFCHAVCAAMHG